MKLTLDTIPQSFERAIQEAIQQAEQASQGGQYPIGAVVFDANGIIAAASSALVTGNDPSAHPEMVAIRDACAKLGTRYLHEAYLATTLEPCPMCTSVAIWARMKGIVFASTQADALALSSRLRSEKFTFRQIHLRCREVAKAGEPELEVFEEVGREAVLHMYDRFAIRLNETTTDG